MGRSITWIHADQAKGRATIGRPLAPAALAVLQKQVGKHDEWVFPYRGGPIVQPANTAWLDALEKANLKNFRWHDLRHTWASWHVQNGTPLPVLMELGAWKDLKMVLRYATSRQPISRSTPATTLNFQDKSPHNGGTRSVHYQQTLGKLGWPMD